MFVKYFFVYKVILVANSTWNIFNFRLKLIETLVSNGFQVFVVSPTDRYLSFLENFPEVIHIPLENLKRKSLNPFDDLKLFFELYKIYKQVKPDVLLHYTIKPNVYGGLAARILRIKNIPIITGLGYTFLNKGLLYSLTNILYRLSFKKAEKVIFENIDDRRVFIEKKIVTQNKSISVKGCGTDINHFKPQEKEKRSEKLIISYVGRYLYDKGILEFVKAAEIVKKEFSNVEFWLNGSADFGNPASIKEHELNEWINKKIITDKGFADDVRIPISESDCIVCPSYREAIPRVIQEGMAMEKIAITTDVPGCNEAVDHNINGFLVDAKNYKQLAVAFIRVIQMSSEERTAFGKAGRQKVIEIFDDRIIATQILLEVQKAVEIKVTCSDIVKDNSRVPDYKIASFQLLNNAAKN